MFATGFLGPECDLGDKGKLRKSNLIVLILELTVIVLILELTELQ